MPVSPRTMLLTCALLCCGAVSGETLIPLNGQSQQQIQNDIAACQSQAAGNSATSSSGTGGALAWVTAATGGTVRSRALMPGTSPMPRAICRASRATEPPRL